MSYDIISAIKALKIDSNVSVNNEDINQITDKQAELKTIYDNNKYQRDRKDSYPSIEDQLDEIYHKGISGWMNTIKAVKDKYPKG